MNKIKIISLLFLSLFLASCGNKDKEPDPSDKALVQSISDVLEKYSYTNTTGYNYIVEQKVDNIVTNGSYVEQRIEYTEDIKIYTETTNITLNDLSSTEQSSTETVVDFYTNNNKLYYDQDNNLQTVSISIEDYLGSDFILKAITLEMFDDYTISQTGSMIEINGEVLSSSYNEILDDTASINSLELTVVIDTDTDQLIKLEINYTQNISSTRITFEPYFIDVQVVIPEN